MGGKAGISVSSGGAAARVHGFREGLLMLAPPAHSVASTPPPWLLVHSLIGATEERPAGSFEPGPRECL